MLASAKIKPGESPELSIEHVRIAVDLAVQRYREGKPIGFPRSTLLVLVQALDMGDEPEIITAPTGTGP